MKKVWENPELNGLGVNETKEAEGEVRYSTVRTFDMRGTVKYLCLGVYQVGTDIKIADCPEPGPYDDYFAWAAHAAEVHSGLKTGQKVEITPVS